MIDPIGPSLLFSGPQPPPRRHQAPPRGPSFIRSGARRQPVLWRSPDPWSSATSLRSTTFLPAVSDENHIRHFRIFVRNTEISLKFLSDIAIMFYGALSLAPSDPSF